MSGWIGAWGTTATVTNLTVTGGEVILVNTSTDALRITQTGAGNALVVEDSANPDASPFVIDANGKVGVGLSSPIGGVDLFQVGGQLTSEITTNANVESFFVTRQNSASAGAGGGIIFGAQSGSFAAVKALLNNGSGNTTGDLAFSTRNATGDAALTERMRINSAGNIYGASGTTSMTNGFFYIPSAAGAPSGVPTAISGRVPMYYDTTNNNFYVYNGSWKKVLLG